MRSENDAADWFARMRGPDAADAHEGFARWYADPANAAAYDHLARTWDQAKFLANTPTGRARDLGRAGVGARRRAIAVGAGALLTAALCLMAISRIVHPGSRSGSPASPAEIAAAADASRMVRLGDGSRALLDRGARLVIAFNGAQRRLRLLAGRARFDVARDPARPFVVEAGGGSVVAHGTMFDVALGAKGMAVVLLRGAVEVRGPMSGTTPGQVRHLAPGQKVILTGRTLTMPVAATAIDIQWPRPMIEFEATPLDEAVARFNRGGGLPIRVEGLGGRHLLVTGAFRRDDPDAFAGALAAAFGLDVRRDGAAGLVLAPPAPADAKKP